MINNLNSIVGAHLSEVLKNEKQEATAAKLNVQQGTVSKWKTGKQIPDPETLVRIAEMYDVSLDWILGLSEDKERNGISSDKISYAQVIAVLDSLFNLANIEVLNFHEAAKEKRLSVGYRRKDDKDLIGDTDYIKVNDKVLSFLLRRRKVIYEFGESYAKDWVDQCIAIFKNLKMLNYTSDIDEIIEGKPTSTFKEGDWGALVEEIANMNEDERQEYLNSKSKTKDGKENG